MSAESIGSKIMEALTKDQVSQLVEAVFSVIDSKDRNQVLGCVSPDIRKTLSKLLSGGMATKRKVVSAEKNLEKWNHLWSQWYEAVFEVGEEDGKYVRQEDHWEAPYFDGYILAEDLEKIAKNMFPLIEEIFPAGVKDKDVFAEAIETIEQNIESYPEWMGADYEGLCLEPVTTRCLLQWEWLVAGVVEVFLDRMIALDGRLKIVGLDVDTFIDFFTLLSAETQRKIYEYIHVKRNQPVWQKELGSSRSKWHKLYHALAKKFDRTVVID